MNQDITLSTSLLVTIIAVSIWDLAWRGFALWKAATSKQRRWFIALLLINSAGIVPVLYLSIVHKKHLS